MTTSISSKAFSNYKKDIWKIKVEKMKCKKKTKILNRQKSRNLSTHFDSFTFMMYFVSQPIDR